MEREQKLARRLTTLKILATFGLAILVIVPLNPIFVSSANAEPPQVVFEVSPQEVKLPSKDGAVAIAILRNPSMTDPLRNVRLTTFTDAGVKVVSQESTELKELEPGADHAWTLRVTPTGEGPMSGTVRLRVDYDWVAASETTSGEPRIVPQTKAISLTVTDLTPQTLDEVAKAEVQTGFGSLGPISLSHERPGTIYLSVSNMSKMPVTVTGVSPKRPENMIDFNCERTEFVKRSCKLRGDTGIPIGPKQKITIPIEVEPTERVTPGRYVLLFEIPIEWGWPGTDQQADLFAKQEISVEVFGESQIIGALGLPTGIVTVLLVLPGFLILGIWTLLWRFIPLNGEAKSENSFPIGKGDLAFYIVALTISVVFIRIYSLFTKHDFLQSYGVRDILAFWFISMVVGCGLYLLVWVPVILYKKLLTPSWEPIPFLQKLAWQGRLKRREPGLWLDRAKVELNGKPFELFLLEPKSKNREEVWVGPYITMTWKKKDADLNQEEKELKAKIREHLKAPGAPAPLANSLKKRKASDILNMQWDRSKGDPGPHPIGKDKVKDWFLGQANIIEEK